MPHLRAVSARDDGGVSAVVIEATEPVAYVTSQPDPLTVLVDLRNVRADGIQAGATGRGLAPLRGVQVEESHSADGTPLARVRVNLDRAASHRVRTTRNLIVVEVDRTRPVQVSTVAAAATTAVRAAATELRAVRASRSGDEVTVAIVGNGPLTATTVQEAKDMPPRVLLDFEGVAAGRTVPAVVGVNQADVARVRVATNSRTPLVTRVVVDLKRKTPYRVEPAGADGEELRVIFTAPADAPAAAPAPTPVTIAAAPVVAPLTPTPPEPAAVPVVVAPIPAPEAVAGRAAAPTPLANQAQSGMLQLPAGDTAAKPKFTGHPVSLDFQGADLRAVLRTFSEISGLNIVIDPTISGSVDVSLRDVPWDQALDIILKANKLGYFVDGTIVRIAPLTVLADEESQRRKLTDEQALAGELRVMTHALSYAKAADLVPIITRSALSSRGEVQVDPRTNTVIIRDLPDRLTAATSLLAALDLPQPQVEIEARIVQTTRDFARSIGV
ncbi:MAG: secretin N-terminal domain-containing protein, partial [Acidobacteriota bacterium]